MQGGFSVRLAPTEFEVALQLRSKLTGATKGHQMSTRHFLELEAQAFTNYATLKLYWKESIIAGLHDSRRYIRPLPQRPRLGEWLFGLRRFPSSECLSFDVGRHVVEKIALDIKVWIRPAHSRRKFRSFALKSGI
jgi:hypothetical protein